MTIRVIQWATGGVGRAAIQGIVDHPELELVGCWVHSDAKVGRDAGGRSVRAASLRFRFVLGLFRCSFSLRRFMLVLV